VNYYELIYLNKELNVKLRSETLHRIISPQKNIVELYIGEHCIRFHAVPPTPYMYVRSWNSVKKKNVINFFPELYGQKVQEILSLTQERYLGIRFSGGATIWFEVFGSRANLYLEVEGQLCDSFKTCHPNLKGAEKRWKWAMQENTLSSSDTKLFSAVAEAIKKSTLNDALIKSDNAVRIDSDPKVLKKKLFTLHPSIERTHLESLIDLYLSQASELKEIHLFIEECHHQLTEHAEFRLLDDGSRTLFPEAYLPKSTRETFSSISDLLFRHTSSIQRERRYKQLMAASLKELDKATKRTQVNVNQLEKAVQNQEKAIIWEEYGHILMTMAHRAKPESEMLTVQNYFRNNEEAKIKLDIERSFVDNAQRYYKKASNAKRSMETVKQQLPLLKQRLEALLVGKESLRIINDIKDLNNWRKDMFEKGLLNNEPGHGLTSNHSIGTKARVARSNTHSKKQNSTQTMSKPYHECTVSGFSIWIGKNARSNDKMLSLAHKDDIWLHAKSVSGSHVIIRAQQKMPDKSVIEIAASFAAHQSKAKGSEWVPVIFTPKKYVRKAKNSAPGAVIVQKEHVVMVQPIEPRDA
jgi:predicted ribosome quality control (RQC) complex YloA/Tae2 family protein